ncbi:hypothetical protein MHZ90_20755 [Pantoea sp. ACRSH]|uniref:hypothetical protein n=1 Tax=Erwiniaceae TaxID=1903409 RepID=UPI001EF4317F|nr:MULTISPECIES: hypothetical protein [Erwiniaceae]MCG7368529.1 hypothetical protein [Pantoea sp. ACRSH]MCG7398925.1 hypothetical protein [Pantoea sp. ACRSC]
MDLKDVLTPLVTLAGVWLAARFTLRNEVQKKALEIRTARLESIAGDCNEALTGIRNYAGTSLHLIEMAFRQKGEQPGAPTALSELRISVEELGNQALLPQDGNRMPDIVKIRHCWHQLAFHRPDEARRWKKTVSPLLQTLNDFLMITMPGEPVRDMKNVTRSAEDELRFRQAVHNQLLALEHFQDALTARLSAEFTALTQPWAFSVRARLRRLLPGRCR